MPNDTRPTKAQRQADARARAAELRRKQESAARRNRILAVGGAIVAVIVIVAAIGLVFLQNHQNAAKYADVVYAGSDFESSSLVAPSLASVKKPSVANDSGGIPVSDEGVGKAGSGDTTLTVYFDMQCPYCAQFDKANASDLQALAKEPGITVLYQPLSFLDDSSQGTHYSNRAANALMVVADQDPDHFTAFMTALYADQPAENTKGMADDKIASIATGVGVPKSVVDQFTATVTGTYQTKDSGASTGQTPAASDGATSGSSGNVTEHTGTWRTFAPFVAAATAHADQTLGSLSTPTLLLDGKQIGTQSDGLNIYQEGPLKAEVEQAAAAKG